LKACNSGRSRPGRWTGPEGEPSALADVAFTGSVVAAETGIVEEAVAADGFVVGPTGTCIVVEIAFPTAGGVDDTFVEGCTWLAAAVGFGVGPTGTYLVVETAFPVTGGVDDAFVEGCAASCAYNADTADISENASVADAAKLAFRHNRDAM
jgi:hypothetical protein